MASEIVREYEAENGHKLREYASGAVYDLTARKLQDNTKTRITSENSRALHQARRDKTAALLRQEISRAIFGPEIANKPIQAVATVGAQLYQQIANNPEANARYRLEVWQAIGRHAGLLGDNRQDATQDGVTVTIGADLARDLVAKLVQSRNNE